MTTNLKHCNIVGFVGVCRKPMAWCIGTEYAKGGSLRQFLMKMQNRSVTLRLAINYTHGVRVHTQGFEVWQSTYICRQINQNCRFWGPSHWGEDWILFCLFKKTSTFLAIILLYFKPFLQILTFFLNLYRSIKTCCYLENSKALLGTYSLGFLRRREEDNWRTAALANFHDKDEAIDLSFNLC